MTTKISVPSTIHAGALPRVLLVGVVLAMGAACARPGSSFETLGVPRVSPTTNEAALVLGWQNEDREGWSINTVRINERSRETWDAASQRPVVFRLGPGRHVMRLDALHETEQDGRTMRRRFRSPPAEVILRAGAATICAIRIEGRRRRRPRLHCSPRTTPPPPEPSPYRASPTAAIDTSHLSHDADARSHPSHRRPRTNALPSPDSTALVPSPYVRSDSPAGLLEQRLARIEQVLWRILSELETLVDAAGDRDEPSPPL